MNIKKDLELEKIINVAGSIREMRGNINSTCREIARACEENINYKQKREEDRFGWQMHLLAEDKLNRRVNELKKELEDLVIGYYEDKHEPSSEEKVEPDVCTITIPKALQEKINRISTVEEFTKNRVIEEAFSILCSIEEAKKEYELRLSDVSHNLVASVDGPNGTNIDIKIDKNHYKWANF